MEWLVDCDFDLSFRDEPRVIHSEKRVLDRICVLIKNGFSKVVEDDGNWYYEKDGVSCWSFEDLDDINAEQLQVYIDFDDKKISKSVFNKRVAEASDYFKNLLKMWIEDSLSCTELYLDSYGEEIFTEAFDGEWNHYESPIYRGFDLPDEGNVLSVLSDDELKSYLYKNGNVFESGTTCYDVAKEFADDVIGKPGKYAVVIKMKANKYYCINGSSYEKEVILYNPIYDEIVYRKES